MKAKEWDESATGRREPPSPVMHPNSSTVRQRQRKQNKNQMITANSILSLDLPKRTSRLRASAKSGAFQNGHSAIKMVPTPTTVPERMAREQSLPPFQCWADFLPED